MSSALNQAYVLAIAIIVPHNPLVVLSECRQPELEILCYGSHPRNVHSTRSVLLQYTCSWLLCTWYYYTDVCISCVWLCEPFKETWPGNWLCQSTLLGVGLQATLHCTVGSLDSLRLQFYNGSQCEECIIVITRGWVLKCLTTHSYICAIYTWLNLDIYTSRYVPVYSTVARGVPRRCRYGPSFQHTLWLAQLRWMNECGGTLKANWSAVGYLMCHATR